MTHTWHSWRIVPTIQELVQHNAFSLDTLYNSPFCTGLPYSIGPNWDLVRSLCLLSWLLHKIWHFPFDQKVETDSTDTERVHYWMQLAIFGRDPKSAVVSFLQWQQFQFWQKITPKTKPRFNCVCLVEQYWQFLLNIQKKKSLVWFKNGDHLHGFQIQSLTFLDLKMVP